MRGGLKAMGKTKLGDGSNPLISVVTVVYDGGSSLEATLLSILNQTYNLVELLVIDGGSTDDTLEILHKYDSRIDYWVSEPDQGIYDAMNKGISLASGHYINFMNCGDRFFSDEVLSDIFRNRCSKLLAAEVIVGDWEVRYPSGKARLVKAGSVENLSKGSQFCHQAVFISKGYHMDHLYSDTHRLAADFEFFFKAYQAGVNFERVDKVISSIDAGGVSDTRRIEVIRSWWEIVGRGFWNDLYFAGRISRELIVGIVKKALK